MKAYDKLYIDGAWVAPSGKGTLDVINSTTEEVMATIPDGDAADVDRAVKAAKAAFPAWSQTVGARPGQVPHPHQRGPERPHRRDREHRQPKKSACR